MEKRSLFIRWKISGGESIKSYAHRNELTHNNNELRCLSGNVRPKWHRAKKLISVRTHNRQPIQTHLQCAHRNVGRTLNWLNWTWTDAINPFGTCKHPHLHQFDSHIRVCYLRFYGAGTENLHALVHSNSHPFAHNAKKTICIAAESSTTRNWSEFWLRIDRQPCLHTETHIMAL